MRLWHHPRFLNSELVHPECRTTGTLEAHAIRKAIASRVGRLCHLVCDDRNCLLQPVAGGDQPLTYRFRGPLHDPFRSLNGITCWDTGIASSVDIRFSLRKRVALHFVQATRPERNLRRNHIQFDRWNNERLRVHYPTVYAGLNAAATVCAAGAAADALPVTFPITCSASRAAAFLPSDTPRPKALSIGIH